MAKTLAYPIGDTPAFNGIDRRRIESASNPNSAYLGENCDLTPGGAMKSRDVLRPFARLPANTYGLYTANDQLRVAVPAGHGIEFQLPPSFTGDVFGVSESTKTPTGRYARVSTASFFGRDIIKGPYMFLVLELAPSSTGGAISYEHHYIDQFPEIMGRPRDTLVRQSFQPGASLFKYHGKFVAPGRIDDLVHHSSVLNGPRDWTNPGDAGVFAPGQHTGGASELQGFVQHEGLLGCVYPNAMQFWALDVDPSRMNWIRTYEGPGTKMFRSLATATGDTFYFSEGGFRSLVTEITTGERRESDFGAGVFALTQAYANHAPDRVTSLWTPARSQYLCMFAEDTTTRVFAFTLSPSNKIAGWTTWTLPIAVDDAIELKGVMYLRAGDMVYSLAPGDSDVLADGSESPKLAVFETQFLHGGDARKYKHWIGLDVIGAGEFDAWFLPDEADRDTRVLLDRGVPGSTLGGGPIMVDHTAPTIALRFESEKAFEIHSFAFEAAVLGGAR